MATSTGSMSRSPGTAAGNRSSGRVVLHSALWVRAAAEHVSGWAAERFVGLGCPWLRRLPAAGEHVADLGCGAGADLAIATHAAGPEGAAIGIDTRPVLIGPAGAARRRVLVGDACSCPLEDGWATLVVANGLPPLLALATAPAVMDEYRAGAAPGGRLQFIVLVSGADLAGRDVGARALVGAAREGKPLCCQYRALLQSAGFAGIEIDELPSPFVVGFRRGAVTAVLMSASRLWPRRSELSSCGPLAPARVPGTLGVCAGACAGGSSPRPAGAGGAQDGTSCLQRVTL